MGKLNSGFLELDKDYMIFYHKTLSVLCVVEKSSSHAVVLPPPKA